MSYIKKIREKKLNNLELDAQDALMEDLFYDLYRHRGHIYEVNFVRGIFFGFGTFLGGTLVVAILTFVLGWLANTFPAIKDFIDWLMSAFSR